MAPGIRTFLTVSLTASALLAAAAGQQAPAEAKSWLEAGNRRFQAGDVAPPQLGAGARRTAARGQSPRAIVLTCSDADVAPEHVFQAGLGELVVIRLAGNCVDTETIADIEYAASQLAAPLLVVLGHERCSTIATAIRGAEDAERGIQKGVPSPAMQQLLQQFEPAVRRGLQQALVGAELAEMVETDHATAVAAECLRRSETLRRLQQIGRFQVQPARYHQDTGAVEWLLPRPLAETPQEAATVAEASPPTMAPHVALRLLQAGNRRYLGDGKPLGDISPLRRTAIQNGQQPFAIVLTCSDSRVPPEHLFDCGLGELCVIRIAGNVMTDTVLASLELAASRTGAPLIVVLGHGDCSTIREAAQPGEPIRSPGMRALVDRVAPALADQRGGSPELLKAAVTANALRVTGQARQRSITLQQLEQQGRLLLLPAVYDVQSGDIEWLAEPAPKPSAAPAHPPAAPHGEHQSAPKGHGHDTPHADAPLPHGDEHATKAHDEHGDHDANPAPGEEAHGHEAAKAPDLSWANESPAALAHDVHAAPIGESHAPAHSPHGEAPAPHANAHDDQANHGAGDAHGDVEHAATAMHHEPANAPHDAHGQAIPAHDEHAPAAAIDQAHGHEHAPAA
ncbi:MAG: carbonic anhydrase, partial [Planctomycetota bacterium]